MGRKKKVEYAKTVPALPEGWEILNTRGEYAIVKMRKDDLTRVRLLKLPKEVRDYFKQRQREYRERQRENRKKKRLS